MTGRARGALHLLGMAVITLFYALPSFVLLVCPEPWQRWFVRHWNSVQLGWLGIACGIRVRIEGLEHLPAGPVVLLPNHQSTWETFALPALLPRPVTFVIKRELLRIPLFGWGMRLMRPIAIDRGSPREALRALLRQGGATLFAGVTVVVFPEGTRVPVGQSLPYRAGGAMLARHAGVPVVPVAHNAGEFWPRGGLTRRPGTVRLRFGPPLASDGDTAGLMREVEAWVTAARADFSARPDPPGAQNPPR